MADHVQPWPPLVGTPVCTVRAAAPAAAVLAVMADELGRMGLRVRLETTGLQVRSPRALVKNTLGFAVGMLTGSGGDSFSTAVFTVITTEDGPAGAVLEAGVRRGDGSAPDLRTAVPTALSAALRRLWAGGAAVSVGPWERRGPRGSRHPVTGHPGVRP